MGMGLSTNSSGFTLNPGNRIRVHQGYVLDNTGFNFKTVAGTDYSSLAV